MDFYAGYAGYAWFVLWSLCLGFAAGLVAHRVVKDPVHATFWAAVAASALALGPPLLAEALRNPEKLGQLVGNLGFAIPWMVVPALGAEAARRVLSRVAGRRRAGGREEQDDHAR